MELKQACDALRANENKEVAALVIQDKALQRILAIWPMVRREELPGITADMSFADLWSIVRIDEREVADLSGLASGLGIATYRRARGLGLIYPDGSVHQLAAMVLRKLIKDALQSGAAK